MRTFSFPLFVPATRPDRFAKAASSGTDTVIVDLEDAVAEDAKDAARDEAAQALGDISGADVWLRVNGSDTDWHDADIELAVAAHVNGIVLPKCESVDQLKHVRAALSVDQSIIALIESARGVRAAYEIAEVSDRLMFGSIDYALDVGCQLTQEASLFARSKLVIASRAARIPPPLDGVTTSLEDEGLVRSDAAHASGLGFGGKLLIHPNQIQPARTGFAPSAEEIEWARNILSGGDGGEARSVGGEMIDAPVVERARRLLLRYEETA